MHGPGGVSYVLIPFQPRTATKPNNAASEIKSESSSASDGQPAATAPRPRPKPANLGAYPLEDSCELFFRSTWESEFVIIKAKKAPWSRGQGWREWSDDGILLDESISCVPIGAPTSSAEAFTRVGDTLWVRCQLGDPNGKPLPALPV